MKTQVTVLMKNATSSPDVRDPDLTPGYYICRYANHDHVVLVHGEGKERRAIALENPEGLYWTTPFLLQQVRPVRELTITPTL